VPDRKQGMMPDHARPRIEHNLPDLLPHLGLIAVDRTVAAGCLVFLERAVLQPESCVFSKFTAFATEFFFCVVLIPAEDSDHAFNGFPLSFHAGMRLGLDFIHSCCAMFMPLTDIYLIVHARRRCPATQYFDLCRAGHFLGMDITYGVIHNKLKNWYGNWAMTRYRVNFPKFKQ